MLHLDKKISHVQLQQLIMYHSETESCTFSHGRYVLYPTPHPQKYVSKVARFNVSVQVPVLSCANFSPVFQAHMKA
jgi:hypothetical protein